MFICCDWIVIGSCVVYGYECLMKVKGVRVWVVEFF